jgi:hypothetical protein
VEVLIAISIVAGSVAAVAQLVALGARANRLARHTTLAVVFAQQKMEELMPDAAAGLTPSPPGALDRDVDGFSDVVDGAFTRRWSVDPLPGGSAGAVVLQVLVADARNPATVRAHLTSTRTRQGF